ncbi:formylglycine-generating enzyme family protein [Lignipirellula cremea]|uniref:Serine/threonine-protein kinase pkn1 n=1 Tax=Lignipirellula cremea TaxID=2528010 RepID=A0A518DKY9_9BACT|nr:formylglycine-generating enzyme family protein [Lignipirellula cremea]QDU92486.1 Serine/threonine-protein kinase pkn1 [Lignipirellula cremea]
MHFTIPHRFPRRFAAGACWIFLLAAAPFSLLENPPAVFAQGPPPEERYEWPADAPPVAAVPFDARQALAHQQAWAAYLKLPTQKTVELKGGVKMPMQLIPPGEFRPGFGPGRSRGRPTFIDKPFWIAETEVTQAQWEALMGPQKADPRLSNLYPTGPRLPVAQITAAEAVAFCEALTQQERDAGRLPAGYQYDLPSPYQWEFACSGGTETTWFFGDDASKLGEYAWFGEAARTPSEDGGLGQPVPHEVAQKKPSIWGLYDVYGNVGEFCVTQIQLINAAGGEAPGPTDPLYVQYGGACYEKPERITSSSKVRVPGDLPKPNLGFRVVLTEPVFIKRRPPPPRPTRPPPSSTPDNVMPPLEVADGPGGVDWPASAPPRATVPFDARQAQAHQQAWSDYLGMPVERKIALPHGVSLNMVLIPPGDFKMGSSPGEFEGGKIDQYPRHRVWITKPYYLGKYEVTVGEWDAVMRLKKSPPDLSYSPLGGRSVAQLHEFVTQLNALVADEKIRFALPTEAQWEFACRAGTETDWCVADEKQLFSYSWYRDSQLREKALPEGETRRLTGAAALNDFLAGNKVRDGFIERRNANIGQLNANAFGLHDMHGNVREVCSDFYDRSYYSSSPPNDPTGPPSGDLHVARGGSYGEVAWRVSSSVRYMVTPRASDTQTGLRLVMILLDK